MKPMTFRYFERGGVALVGLALIGSGFWLLPDATLLGDVTVHGKDIAFRGSVPLFVMALGVSLLVALVYWGGASTRMKTTEKKTERTTGDSASEELP